MQQLFIAALLACSALAAPAQNNLVRPKQQPTPLPSQYIIKLKPNADHRSFDRQLKQALNRDAMAAPGESYLSHQYTKAFKGYAGRFSQNVLSSIRADPNVAYIEQDSVGWVEGMQVSPPSWGLARVVQRLEPKLGDYMYPDSAGEGVTAYIIDTGIDTNHTEFEGRATFGVNFIKGEDPVDGYGHGTHVAGTVIGKNYGIAKKAKAVAVKVCNKFGSCSVSDVVAGINYVIQNATKFKSTVNISLGLQASQAIDDAVNAAVEAGIAIIVSGGNASTDSCLNSPRRAKLSFAVGAMAKDDTKASFSNYGKCLKIFAPGVDIVSTLPNNQTDAWSGTSMASPHVCGIAALYLAEKQYTSIIDLHGDLTARSTQKAVKGVPADTVDNLAFVFLKDTSAPATGETPLPSTPSTP